MPELRRDPLLNRWVIVAEERMLRPGAGRARLVTEFPPLAPEDDPFMAGNERHTPDEIYALRPDGSEPNSPGWMVRVVPNRFPALRVEGELDPRGFGIYDRLNGIGAHEVVIETPDQRQLGDLSVEHISAIFETIRLRIEDLSRDMRLAHILAFKNHGSSAGATQIHSHSQIIATPVMPVLVREQLSALKLHWQQKRRSLFADMLDQELQERHRVIVENETMVAFCPFASAFPFELQIMPRSQSSDFRHASAADLDSLALALKLCLLKWQGALGDVAYNLYLRSAPFNTALATVDAEFPMLADTYCWHVVMFPRLTMPAGFEWATGQFINPVAPERAAEALRCIEVSIP